MDDAGLEGTLFAGRFHIESLLGEGATGSVYLATHDVLKRRFAVKIIRRELLEDDREGERFRRAARATSRVEHPHITFVFDFGYTDDGVPYMVLEYAEGPTLGMVLDRQGALPLPRTLDLLGQIAGALEAAHARQVVHRDLKPSNVILTSQGAREDFVKILDFGLAKVLGVNSVPTSTVTGELQGTPEYMSPEQCTGDPVDHRADIYALGVLAYELVVGTVPFDFGGNEVKTWDAHVHLPPPVPSQVAGRDDVPAGLDEVILRCLAKQPGERFADAGELSTALAAI